VNARGLAAFAAAMPWKCADSVARGRSPPAWVDTPAMGPDRWWIEMHDMRAFRSIRSIDDAIARIASRLGGVVDRAQLSALGLGRGAIRHRIDVGRLRPLYPGVYAVGHEAIQTRGRLVAGLLVAGPGAALSHRTAAALRKLTPSMPQCVEITTTSTRPRDRPGLIFHCATRLDATSRHELPVTSPIRTLLDLAATRPRQEVERACSEALVHELVTVDAIAGQHGRGSAVLRRIVADGVAPTRSELERRFFAAVLRAGLPRPQVNAKIGRYTVDFLWTDRRLVVELDGYRFHGHRLAFERDRSRDAELQLLGYAVLRLTWRQLRDEPALVARYLTARASRRAS
jgi:very-short-patch-repair endonuclease